jgi:TPR repeat protein
MTQVWLGSTADWNTLKQLADEGDNPLAAAMVALCYSHIAIRVVPNCLDEARLYVNKSLPWLQEEVVRGCKYAQLYLGLLIASDVALTRDLEEAFRLCRLSAEQGYPIAVNALGDFYFFGTGVTMDKVEAVRLFQQAAQQGCGVAQNNLPKCYEKGIGVTSDMSEAIRWYRLAADQGHTDAQFSLGICYLAGNGVEKDPTEALRWYRLAADKGDADAQLDVGVCYHHGKGVEKD